jgi:hypothetical protein
VIREADVDNPRGYYEFEPVKKIEKDVSWIPELRSKVVKMVSQLLYDSNFLAGRTDVRAMAEAVDPSLYRNRNASSPLEE